MSRRIALLLFLATEAAYALKPAPDKASCDPIGPRKDCGEQKRAAWPSTLSVQKYYVTCLNCCVCA